MVRLGRRTRRAWRWRLATACVVLATLLSVTPAARAASIGAKRVAGGLNEPVAFTFGPHDRIWYVEKDTGEIRVFNRNNGRDRLFRRVAGVDGTGERGMLGIALHPKYPDKPHVFVYATRTVEGNLKNEILRFTNSHGSGTGLEVIFSSPASASPYHNGGRILFGPDGMLYAVVGEGHDAGNAQDTTNNDRGKILRMRPGGGVPSDNPIEGSRIWAYGIRNSFGFAFDPQTGSLWESENGPSCNDELNLIVEGANYGWGPNETCSGSGPENTNQDGPSPTLPQLWYENPFGPTGVAFCEGCGLGADGDLFFGAVNTGDIRQVELDGAREDATSQSIAYTHPGSVLSMEVGPDGSIYFSDFEGIFRLRSS